MDAISVKRMEEKLLRRKNEIMPVLDQLAQQSEETTGNYHFEWLNESQAGSEAGTVNRLKEFYRCELAEIERALGRVQSGGFGVCLACHRRMPSSRLERFPQAEFCRECEETKATFEERDRPEAANRFYG